jgi:hypothetical protein
MSEEPENAEASSGWKRLGNIFARIVLYGLLLFVLLVLSSVFIWPLELAMRLIVGPFIHAWKNLLPLFNQWRSALLPLACLAVAVVLAHRFILSWIKAKDIHISWRWQHTGSTVFLILLGSAAAIAMSGITHQASWLFSSPWLESNHRPYQTIAVSNARQIVLALFEYETTYGKYPEALIETAKVSELPPSALWIITGNGKPREPFIFLKPGRGSTGKIEPVLVSPVFQSGNKIVVG